MDTTAGKMTTIVGICALIALVAFAVWAVERGKSTSTEQVFQPPVYETGEFPDTLVSPLFLAVGEQGATVLTSEAARMVGAFKQKILARLALKKPLSGEEKDILRTSISTADAPSVGALVLVNQTMLRFTPDELARIEAALAL